MSGLHTLRSRRDALKGLGGTAFALLAASSQADAASSASRCVAGRVIDSETGRGLSGVMVSNGRDVVLSNRAGAYQLPVRRGDMVFAVKPPHWTYATKGGTIQTGVPQMSYRVETSSRMSLRPDETFVPAVRAGARNADFHFVRAPEPHDFDVLLFADTHAGDARELGYVRELVKHGIAGTPAVFALHHGDALSAPDMFEDYRAMLGGSGLLWHHCPGNHDMRLGFGGGESTADWTRHMGPSHYAFRYGRATFILLNNVEDLARPHDPRPYRGAVSREQLAFVAAVLRHVPKSDLVVLSMHIPLVCFAHPGSERDTTVNRAALLGLLAGRPHTISFSGHSHTIEHHYLGAADGYRGGALHHHQVLSAACGGWWGGALDEGGVPLAFNPDGSPKGHHVLSVRGVSAETRFVPYRPEQQVRALVEERRLVGLSEVTAQLVNGRLVVNVFDGGPKTKVHCRIGGPDAAPIALAQTAQEDPFVVETYARERSLLKPWVYPARCSHLWTLDLPAGLTAGAHDILVQTEGEFGQRHDHKLTLRV